MTTTFVSATQLTAAVPASDVAARGTVPVTVVNTGASASNPLPFTITAGATLTSLSPTSKPAGNAQFTLTVNGTNLVNGAVVYWNGAALTTTYVSATELTAIVPASDVATPGTAQVTAANPHTSPTNALTFTITNASAILTSLSPSSAQAGSGGFTLIVNGLKFVNGAVVKWNNAALATAYLGPTVVVAYVPASDVATAGTASVVVAIPGALASNALTFTITPAPAPAHLTSLSPFTAAAGSASFTLIVNGTGFVTGAVVKWNGVALTSAYLSSTVVVAQVPASDVAAAGTASVTVVNPGVAASNALAFTVTGGAAAAHLTSLSPNAARAGSASFTMTVTGTGFVSGAVVNWNGSARTTTFVSATQLKAVVHTSDLAAQGTAQVTAVNPGASASNALTFTVIAP